jgi:chemotaxis family two-component system sensor histidine kinase/response regulator PixL
MSGTDSPKRKILLADDDASIRRFIEITLERAGYEVASSEDGLAAMKIAFAADVDAVVADAMMPNMTGHDLCRVLRQNPQTKNIPLIVLSGLESEPADAETRLADAYLVKGANLKENLLQTLEALLQPSLETA